jgi:hypothetical protein
MVVHQTRTMVAAVVVQEVLVQMQEHQDHQHQEMVEQDFHLHFLELLQHILAAVVVHSDQVLHLAQMVEMVILLLDHLLVIILAVVAVVDEVGLQLVVRAVRV